MGSRRVRPADDARPAGKLYGPDKHALRYGHPHHDHGPAVRHDGDGDRPRRGDPIERVRPGEDPTPAIERLYREGRHHPDRVPHDRSYQQEARRVAHNPMAAADQSANQFHDEGVADHVDVGRQWTRGYGSESPHPAFDRRVSGVSDHKYRK